MNINKEIQMRLYDRFYSKEKDSRDIRPNDLAVQSVKHITKGEALDLGCGEGQDSIFLKQSGFNVTAIDTSKVALDNLLELAKDYNVELDVVHSDIKTFKFDKQYDFVLAEGSIHFLKNDQIKPFIRTLQDNTNVNGVHSLEFFNHKTSKNQVNSMAKWGISTIDTEVLVEYYKGWEILSMKEELQEKNEYSKRGITQLIVKKIT
ncbi:MAG: methyltransferase domain-containing protein [Clostridiales bacterium]|nr:methyltransferase domain-containing protein [Clostridiales bacterium]